MTLQNQARIKEIYEYLKLDLKRCIRYHRRNQPELVKEYFWTDQRDKINDQLQVICKPFSPIQKIQIERLISDLHIFYSVNSKKSLKLKSKSLSEKTTSEA